MPSSTPQHTGYSTSHQMECHVVHLGPWVAWPCHPLVLSESALQTVQTTRNWGEREGARRVVSEQAGWWLGVGEEDLAREE